MNGPKEHFDDKEIEPMEYDLPDANFKREIKVYPPDKIHQEDMENGDIMNKYKPGKIKRHYYGYHSDLGEKEYIHKMVSVEPGLMVEVESARYPDESEGAFIRGPAQVRDYSFTIVVNEYMLEGTIAITKPSEAEIFFNDLERSVRTKGGPQTLKALEERYGGIKDEKGTPFLSYKVIKNRFTRAS